MYLYSREPELAMVFTMQISICLQDPTPFQRFYIPIHNSIYLIYI